MLRQKELKYISKWGNKSKVGAIINDYNKEMLDTLNVPTPKKIAGKKEYGVFSPSAD